MGEYDSQINALCYLGTMPSLVLFFHMHPLKKTTDTFPAALGLWALCLVGPSQVCSLVMVSGLLTAVAALVSGLGL